MKNILFVCTGNTCRSPMAEAIMRLMVFKHPRLRGRVNVMSAGTRAVEDDVMSLNARLALEKLGISDEGHSSQPVSIDLISEADLILAMEAGHLDELLSLYPEAEGKAYTLKDYASQEGGDIADPYGRIVDVYVSTAKEITSALESVVERLENMTDWAG